MYNKNKYHQNLEASIELIVLNFSIVILIFP